MASVQPGGNTISQETISMEEGTNLLAAAAAAPSCVVSTGVGCCLSASETMHNLQKEAFQPANYYFVFQGVIFTAVYSTPSNLKCEYHWAPFTLSFLAGILNLFALLTIALKYKKLLDEKDCKETRLELEDGPTAPSGMRVSPEGRIVHEPSDQRRGGNSLPIMVSCVGNWRMLYVIGCMGLFAGFFVVTLVGCMTITSAKN